MAEIKVALFKNDKKTKDTQPDYRGYDKDTNHEVAGWIKKDKNGNQFLSLVIKPKTEQGSTNGQPSQNNVSTGQTGGNTGNSGFANPDEKSDLPF